MARRSHHMSMTVRDGHKHRYLAECSCGWTAIPLRKRTSALREFRRHADAPKARQNDAGLRRRPVTPPEQSPFGRAVAA